MWGKTRYALVALVVLAATMSLMPGTAEAATYDDFEYNIKSDGTVEITKYIGAGGGVTIPDKIGDKAVTSIGDYVFRECPSLTSVAIPDNVTSIGEWAFYRCPSLTSVSIGNNVTSIGTYAFAYCSSLISITIPDSLTSIGEGVYSGCSSLTSITIPDGVTSVGDWAFAVCYDLTSITIPEGVTSIGYGALYGCSSLTSINIPDSVTSIDGKAFSWCSSLTSITIPDGVTSIVSDAFSWCSSLTSITIPDGVTSIGDNAFEYCPSLTSIVIPDSVTSVGSRAFYGCSSLTEIVIPTNVTYIGVRTFDECYSLDTINVDDGNENYASKDGVLYTKDFTSIIRCPQKKGGAFTCPSSVTSIGDHAFYECSSLSMLIFEGDAPNCQVGWAAKSNPNLKVYFIDGSNGFTTPTWQGFSAIGVISPGMPADADATAGLGSAHISWSAPSNDGNAPFLSYEIWYGTSDVSSDWILFGEVDTNAVTITELEIGTTFYFGVKAVNIAGVSDLCVTSPVVPCTIPGVPQISVVAGDGSVTLSWSELVAPENGWGNIDYFVIYVDGVEVAQTSETPFIITKLNNGEEYSFAVAAHNAGGLGPASPSITASPFTSPDAPNELRVVVGSGQATLSWLAPTFDGGRPVDHYVVYQDGVEIAQTTEAVLVITGLINGQECSFTVAAHNTAGNGAQSNSVLATPFIVPDAPSQLDATPENGQVTLTWTAPDFDGGRPIDYYIVYQDGVALSNHAVGVSVIIDGLNNGQEYSFIVVAHNVAGDSAQSGSVLATPFTMPDAPSQLEATPGDGQVTLTWAAPDFDGGRPIDYYIIYMGGVALPGHPTEPISTITGLTNGQSYSFTVAAHNSAGISPQSVVVESIPFTFSDAPTGLRTILDSGKVTLSWTAPSFDGGRPIDHYVVYQDGVEIAQTAETTHVVEGLNNGQSYVFSVAANSAAGIGLASLPVAAAPSLSIPSSPTSVVAHQLDGGIVMEWMDPIINGGYPITYEVYRGTSAGSATSIGTTSEHSFVDMTCTPGIQYFYHVVATNQMGSSEPSEAVGPISTYSSVLLNVVTDSSSSSIGIVIAISGGAKSVVGNPIGGMSIDLAYSTNNGQTWVGIPSVTTSSGGTFSTQWIPTATGIYMLKASWAGDSTYLASTSIMNLAVTSSSDNYIFTVQSSSTISGLSFDSATNQLSFTVSGEDGTYGYTRIVISKELVVNGTDIKVSLDGAEMNYQLSSTDESWVLYFTYHHSTHGVTVSLGDRSGGAEDSADWISLLIVAMIVAIVGSYAIIRWRKRSD